MTRRSLRTVSLTAVLTLLVLSGCSSLPASREARSPEPRPSPSFTVEDRSGESLTFADGAGFSPDATAGWNDAGVAGDEWILTAPDEGFGTWAYRSGDGGCVATFWQGEVFDMAAPDDRAASDFVLASFMKTDAAAVEGAASDRLMGFGFADNPAAEYRYAEGVRHGGSWALAVRGFAQLKAAVYLTVVCESTDAPAQAADMISRVAIHVSE
ncbi:hypothetical protein [Microbacterium sp. PMB16]|uniref:hypothetical protein n=1 Tax=Microbacterium sp. PMB16 TaxID=3120157 RepID=UPI003F4C605D